MSEQRPENHPEPLNKPTRGRSTTRIVLQFAGFLAGLGLLGWCVANAFKAENREQLAKLGEASPAQIASLLTLSALVLIINGLIFWVVIYPERRLKLLDLIATNALATFVAYVPFKLSVAIRVAVHNRRDQVPLFTIGAWFASIGVLMLVVVGPLAGASFWRGKLDALWWASVIGGSVLLLALTVGLSELFAQERGLARLHKLLDPIAMGPGRRFLRGEAFGRMHAGFNMLAHPGAATGATLLRFADLACQAGRFIIAARILGVEMTPDQAVILAATHFAIGVLSPFGMLGTREAGTVGIASMIGLTGENSVTVVALFITGTESVVFLAGAVLGMVRLRVDRWIRPGPGSASQTET